MAEVEKRLLSFLCGCINCLLFGAGADKKQDVAARKKVVDEEGFAIVPEMSRQESKTVSVSFGV